MSNRYMNQFRYSLENAVVELWGQVAIGATGAPTLSTANSKGIASISRASAGKYTITLVDAYTRLMSVDTMFLVAGIPASPDTSIFSQTISSGGKVIVIQCSVGGVATDPASGETMFFKMALKNSSV